MKNTAKLLSIALATTIVVGATSLADDQQLQTRLAIQRAEAARQNENATTIGVYARERSVGRQTARRTESSERRLVQKDNGHGVSTFIYAPNR